MFLVTKREEGALKCLPISILSSKPREQKFAACRTEIEIPKWGGEEQTLYISIRIHNVLDPTHAKASKVSKNHMNQMSRTNLTVTLGFARLRATSPSNICSFPSKPFVPARYLNTSARNSPRK
jgi:hypothetical protein